MPSRSRPARSYCWTLNGRNNELPDPVLLLDMFESESDFRYVLFQRERSASGTDHYQGYTEYKKPVRMCVVQRSVRGSHVEERRGTRETARDYCRKEDTRVSGPFERGHWIVGGASGSAGTRSDLLAVKEAIDAGASDYDIAQDHFGTFLRYERGISKYRMLKQQLKYRGGSDRGEPEVRVFVGPTGSGKSREAFQSYPNAWWYSAGQNNQGPWFDSYQGEEDVIFDEMTGYLPWTLLLRLTDRYPLNVNTKGGMVPWLARRIIFTSNREPSEWYNADRVGSTLRPLLRRITEIIHFPRTTVTSNIMFTE